MKTAKMLQNRYLIEEQIGQGGMGTVFVATDCRFGTKVAVKKTLFENQDLLKAFEREAQLLNGLRHRALPRVSDYFSEDSGQYLVMEYIAGKDLSEMIETEGAFGVSEVLQWTDTLLDALDYLHNQKTPVVHRDIKPQNLKLSTRGEIILLDFGLAKGSASELTTTTEAKSVFGFSPLFAPLEQIQCAGTDPRSDLFSLAATVYYLLTAKTPSDSLSRARALLAQQLDPLTPLHKINPQIPVAVSKALMQAMAINPQARPADAKTLRAQLAEALKSTVENARQPAGVAVLNSAATVVSTQVRETRPKTQLESRTFTATPSKRPISNTFAPAPPKSNKIPFAIATAILLLISGAAAAFWFNTARDKTAAPTAQAALQQSTATAAQLQQTAPIVSAPPNYNSAAAPINYTTQSVQPAAGVPQSEPAVPITANTPLQTNVQPGSPDLAGAAPNNPAVVPAPTVDAQKLEAERREQEQREQARRLEDETRTAIEQMQRQMNPDGAPPDVRSTPNRMRDYIDRVYEENISRIRDINRRRANIGLNQISEPPAPRHPPMPPGPRPRF